MKTAEEQYICWLIIMDVENEISDDERAFLYEKLNNDRAWYELWKKAGVYYLKEARGRQGNERIHVFLHKKKIERGLVKASLVLGGLALLFYGLKVFSGTGPEEHRGIKEKNAIYYHVSKKNVPDSTGAPLNDSSNTVTVLVF